MDELVNLMEQILAELQEMNSKLDDIKGYGLDNSISDLADKLKGLGPYDSLTDVCDKIESLETTITLGDNY